MSRSSQVHPVLSPSGMLGLLLWAGLATVPVAALTGQLGGLALAFVALTLFVGATVATFSHRYMRADRRPRDFAITVALLVCSVLLSVTSATMVQLAAAWIASGVLLSRLIGHGADWPEARAAALRARWSFAVGDAALLSGLVLLGWHAGTVRIDGALAAVATLPMPLAAAIACLLLVAASARCALPPFSGWLLSSMTAPTPVSALMHAGLVNAGGFLLLRFAPVLEAAPVARGSAVAVGLIAAIQGLGIMLVRPDIKRSLAGSTVSQMGFMIMSCGLGAYSAALWHIVAHGLFKAWLFLGSGSSIGKRADPAARAGSDALPAVATGVLLIGVMLVLQHGSALGALVPLLLGIATAGATVTGAWQAALTLRARISLILGLAGVFVMHGLGLMLSRAASRPDAAPILPGWALIALTAGFLGVWVWQGRRNRALPALLYVRLLNAGTLPTAPKGDA